MERGPAHPARIWSALMLAALPAAAAAASSPPLPGPLDALQAYKDFDAEPCLRLIDFCEDYINLTKLNDIGGLDCRRAGRALARCRFTVSGNLRCRARFVSEDGASWDVVRSLRDGYPRALNVTCRKIERPET